MSRPLESAMEGTTIASNASIDSKKNSMRSSKKSNDADENESRNCNTTTSHDPTFAAMRRRRHQGSYNSFSRSGPSRKRKRRRAAVEKGGVGSNVNNASLSNGSTASSPLGTETFDCYSPSSYSSGSEGSSSEYGGSSSEGEEEDVMFEQDINCKQTISNLTVKHLNAAETNNNDSQKNSAGINAISSQNTSFQENSNENKAYSSADKIEQGNSTSASAPRQNPSLSSNTNVSGDQSSGWRVKLYRLNTDGSWEDCGTGRILCTFVYSNSNNTNLVSESTTSNYSDDAQLYKELGEPTLCMRSESPSSPITSSLQTNDSESDSRNSMPKILLNTRILLRHVYNRQGDNIITWCEPSFASLENTETTIDDAESDGVDLALSFQDNAGCLEIWRQITEVQERAAQLLRHRDESNALTSTVMLANSNFVASAPVSNQTSTNQTTSFHSRIMSNGLHHTNVNNETLDSLQGNHQQNEQIEDRNHSSNSIQNTHFSVSLASDSLEVAHQAQLHHQQHQINHHMYTSPNVSYTDEESYPERDSESTPVNMAAVAATLGSHNSVLLQQHPNAYDITSLSRQLPKHPTLSNLEKISDIFAASQNQQREALVTFLSDNNCFYVRSLLALFPSAEEKGDFGVLATLAALIKSILLLNDPTIVDLVVVEEEVFESVCCALEYDPDLKMKANHRWFMRERVKFKTVVEMEDEELISAIHRSFRVNYLRDTLLRPTMDESSLSTLASLLTFTQSEVVRGVTFYPTASSTHDEEQLQSKKRDSYLTRVLRLLGKEIKALRKAESATVVNTRKKMNEDIDKESSVENLPNSSLDSLNNASSSSPLLKSDSIKSKSFASVSSLAKEKGKISLWRQHLVPQDSLISSRRFRRRGCLSFLRELFSMVRGSLQQSAKDDYYVMIVFMDVDLNDESENIANENSTKSLNNENSFPTSPFSSANQTKDVMKDKVNVLSLMSATISDPHSEVSDRGAALEILSSIVLHDPSLVRRHCLDEYTANTGRMSTFEYHPGRPEPNEHGQVLFKCGPNDLLLSLLYLMAVETDAGLLLQTSEILRIILDTEMMEYGPLGGFVEDESTTISGIGSSEQNKFLSIFYDSYVPWLIAPFQYTIRVSQISAHAGFRKDGNNIYLQFSKMNLECAIRSSFAVDLLCFCVKAHPLRMKLFVGKNRVLNCILKVMDRSVPMHTSGGNRCLKLACLRFFRAVLSLKDDFYHRHIIQQKLFESIFRAFRTNPVGDNLISSAIIEICDFILSENIEPLIEHIATKHLSNKDEQESTVSKTVSLEEVSTPYVDTLTLLRKRYEDNKNANVKVEQGENINGSSLQNRMENEQSYFMNSGLGRIGLSGKALEDQRKFRENDEEDSYFNTDDDDDDHIDMTKKVVSSSGTRALTSLGDAQISSMGESGQQSDAERDIQFQCKLELTMVQFSSSSDEDDDDLLTGDRPSRGNDSDMINRAAKRSLIGRGKRPKIQVVVNSKKKNNLNTSQSNKEAIVAPLSTSNSKTQETALAGSPTSSSLDYASESMETK